jgi:hypothetical protein
MVRAILWALALLAASPAANVPPPPGFPTGIIANAARDPGAIVKFGAFEARIEDTRLEEFQRRFGGGTEAHRGDAAESLGWLCYSLPPKQLVWLGSGELGGGGNTLTEVTALEVEAKDRRLQKCPAIPESSRPVSFTWGWLGSSREALEKELGPTSAKQNDLITWYYDGKQLRPSPFVKDEGKSVQVEADVGATVTLRFRAGRVVGLFVTHATTY